MDAPSSVYYTSKKCLRPTYQKSQSSLEFLMIIAFMTLVFVSFFALANSKLSDSVEQQVYRTAEDIADILREQIELASGLNDGYSSIFVIPQVVDGADYSISVLDRRELVVIFKQYEHVEFLPVNITGNPVFGQNTIAKRNGELFLNS